MSAGLDHTCALNTAGVPYCWGAQTLGLLGNGLDSGLRDTPSAVSGGLVLASIDAGMNVTCGRTASHATYCWGTNTGGELGQGAVGGYSAIPLLVAGRTFAALSVGGNVCGVDPAGAALCWGRNESGQLGSDTGKASVGTPTPVSGGLSFASVESGTDGYTCGATAAGRVYCWGLIYGGPWEGVSTPQLLANGPVVDL